VPSRFQLRGPTLEAIRARVAAEFGPGAQIISAEQVTTGGLAGFFAARHFEAVVEIPGTVVPAGEAATRPLPNLTGMAALLEDVNGAEAGIHGVELPPVSTRSGEFGSLLEDLSLSVAEESAPVPRPMTGPGELIILAGLGNDALTAAESLAAAHDRAVLCIGGSIITGGTSRIDDNAAALAARAEGITHAAGTIVAFGLGSRATLPAYLKALSAVPADQVWLVADAARKEADTAAWTAAAAKIVPVAALAVINAAETLTPATVESLGIPVGWSDGRKPKRKAA
jgi:hypothetical protein